MNRSLLICLSVFSFTFINWQISKADVLECTKVKLQAIETREGIGFIKGKEGADPDQWQIGGYSKESYGSPVETQICDTVMLSAGFGGGGGGRSGPPAPRQATNLQRRNSVNLTTRQTLSFSYEDCLAIGVMPDPKPSSPPSPGHLPVGPTSARAMEQCSLAASALNAPPASPTARGPNVPSQLYKFSLSALTGISPKDLEPWINQVVSSATSRIAGLVPIPVLKVLLTGAVETAIAPATAAALAYTQAVVVPAGQPTMGAPTPSGSSVILYTLLKPVAVSSDRPGTVGKVLKTVGIGAGFTLELTAEVVVVTQVTGRNINDLENNAADLVQRLDKANNGLGFDDVIKAFAGSFYVKLIFNGDIRTPDGWNTAWGTRSNIPRYGLDVIFQRGSDGKIHPEILQHGAIVNM